MSRHITIDLDAFLAAAQSSSWLDCFIRQYEVTVIPAVPQNSCRDDELLSLIEKFWTIAGAEGVTKVDRSVFITDRRFGAEWASSDEAAEEAGRVAVRLWGGLTINSIARNVWAARVFERDAMLGRILGMHSVEADTRGEAAIQAVVAAHEKWGRGG